MGTITIYGLMKSIVRTLTTLALLREGPADQPPRQFGTGVRVFAVSLGVLKSIQYLMNPIVQTLSNLDVSQ